MFSSVDPCWGTPIDVYEDLDDEFHFTIDLCANKNNHKHENYISEEQDFLSMNVEGIGFLNPPYNKPEQACDPSKKCIKKRCEKRGFCRYYYVPGQIDFVAHVDSLAKQGLLTTVAPLPSRTDTAIFHRYIYDKEKNAYRPNVEVRFPEGRLKFLDTDGNPKDPAPFPSMIVIFHKNTKT